MIPNSLNPRVDVFISKSKKWKKEYEELRRIVLESGLTEDFKWMHPCYTIGGKNIVLIHGFKEYCALLFHKGALLTDPQGILIQQTENVQAARQIRFTHAEQILDMESILRPYIAEAIENEKAGRVVEFKETATYTVPEELETRWAENPDLKTAFEALTPGRQRAYLHHFSEPKQAKTRAARIEKRIPQILAGKGLND